MRVGRAAVPLCLCLCVASCVAEPPCSADVAMLTYNVAGLPQGLNDDQFPEQNIPQVSAKLNAYDLVVVQEDFSYTRELRQDLTFAYESNDHVHTERFVNDGLNVFSSLAFDEELQRVRWVECFGGTSNGSDCLANKGFAVSTHQLCDDGTSISVVNLHAEAGGAPEDVAARNAGIDQLIAFIAERFTDSALIVAGDTNLTGGDVDDEPTLQRLLDEAGLQDACRSLDCGDEHIDRVLFRSGPALEVAADSWQVADEFVDAEGNDLSDHKAIHVDLAIRATETAP